jgi:hypothetical protein
LARNANVDCSRKERKEQPMARLDENVKSKNRSSSGCGERELTELRVVVAKMRNAGYWGSQNQRLMYNHLTNTMYLPFPTSVHDGMQPLPVNHPNQTSTGLYLRHASRVKLHLQVRCRKLLHITNYKYRSSQALRLSRLCNYLGQP